MIVSTDALRCACAIEVWLGTLQVLRVAASGLGCVHASSFVLDCSSLKLFHFGIFKLAFVVAAAERGVCGGCILYLWEGWESRLVG